MKLHLLVVAALAPLAVSALVVSSALAGDDSKDRMKERLRGVNFVSSCTFTHRAPDDPIVFFGQPGASHDHSFVGNTSTNASSTLAVAAGSGHDVSSSRRHRGVLDADAARRTVSR